MQAIGIDHVVLRVRDLAQAESFYVEVLGCRVERRLDDGKLVQLRVGDALLDLLDAGGAMGLAQAGGGGDGASVDHVCLRIADFDLRRAHIELIEAGVLVGSSGRRFGANGEGEALYLRDPDGNSLELRG